MKTLGRRSLATFLRVALRVVQVLLFVAVPVMVFACTVILLKTYGVEIDWEMWEEVRAAPAPVFAWIYMIRSVAGLVCAIIIVTQLRNIFATVSAGDPFVPENADYLRWIWITLAANELLRYALNFVRSLALSAYEMELPLRMQEDRLTISLSMWFAVLTVIVLAEVFREGSRLRQEQQLTI